MNSNLSLINTWKSLTVLVIGDVILDCYLNGTADRLCREAPVPIVAIEQCQEFPGGAANTAANVASLGAEVFLLSVIGEDIAGDRLKHVLNQRGVNPQYLITDADRSTLAKHRVVADSQLLVRFDQGSVEAISSYTEHQLIQHLTNLFVQCDAIIISDYNYGILTSAVIQTLGDLQTKHPRVLVVDSKHLANYRSLKPTAVKPNYAETTQLLKLPKQSGQRAEQILPYGDHLLNLTGAEMVAVTLDFEGALLFERNQSPCRTTARPAPQNQTSGAGDTYISTLALALAAGAPAHTAALLASTATAVVVQQPGTTTCRFEQLHQFLNGSEKLITDASDLAAKVQCHRAMGDRIVFTNGCFDILHPGHATYLAQAKALGSILIVGVNSDESVRRLKGPERPVNPLADRLTILAALESVDYVVPFSESTPHDLIRIICPDIYVKGGDYTREMLPEADLVESLGGVVEILPFVGDRSTTRIIRQICAIYR